MGSEQEVSTAAPTPPVNRSLPGFYFEEHAAEPAYSETATAVPVFLYDARLPSSTKTWLPKIRSFAAFESLSASTPDLRQPFFRRAVKGYFENGGSACYVASIGAKSESVDENAVRGIIHANPGCTLICYPIADSTFSVDSLVEAANLHESIAQANHAFAEAALKAAEAAEAEAKANLQKREADLKAQSSKKAIDDAFELEKAAEETLDNVLKEALKARDNEAAALGMDPKVITYLRQQLNMANKRSESARYALNAANLAMSEATVKEKTTALDKLAAGTQALRAANEKHIEEKKRQNAKSEVQKLEHHMKELIANKVRWSKIWSAILLASKKSSRVFALIDLPESSSVAKVLLGFLSSEADKGSFGYGAAYWPPVKDEAGQAVLPCGMIAAAIQKTDGDRGIWKAPANVTLANAYNTTADVKQDTSLFEGEDTLGVNAIRVFPGRGVKVWGCRTLIEKQNNNRSFVQCSRTLSYIESNLQRLSRFAVFEPSNEITWVKLHNIIYAWLHALWLKGGLAGATETEAFGVLVGKNESMTDEDINNGALRVDIRLALQRPLQFIRLQIRMVGGELSVTDQSNAGGPSK